jgi:hypothetical protein
MLGRLAAMGEHFTVGATSGLQIISKQGLLVGLRGQRNQHQAGRHPLEGKLRAEHGLVLSIPAEPHLLKQIPIHHSPNWQSFIQPRDVQEQKAGCSTKYHHRCERLSQRSQAAHPKATSNDKASSILKLN